LQSAAQPIIDLTSDLRNLMETSALEPQVLATIVAFD
jgi:hypothetical protein